MIRVIAGATLADLLTVLFVGLKLTGHIDWSWVGVLSPCWIPLLWGMLTYAVGATIELFEPPTKNP